MERITRAIQSPSIKTVSRACPICGYVIPRSIRRRIMVSDNGQGSPSYVCACVDTHTYTHYIYTRANGGAALFCERQLRISASLRSVGCATPVEALPCVCPRPNARGFCCRIGALCPLSGVLCSRKSCAHCGRSAPHGLSPGVLALDKRLLRAFAILAMPRYAYHA